MSISLLILIISIFQLSTQADPDVLFIGNSLTYYNTLCNVVKGIAEKRGHKLNVVAATNGGKDLIFQSTADNVLKPLKKGGYEYVILQDIVSTFNGEKLLEGGKTCVKLAKQYSPDAQIIFYEPPPKRDELDGKNGKLPYLTHYYIQAARENGARLAPAGEVFYDLYKKHNLDYHVSDGTHPQPVGTFAFASTIYFTIFKDEEYKEWTNSDQKFLDSLINDNVAHTTEGVLKTYDLGILNLCYKLGYQYSHDVSKAVADSKTTYTSVAGEYNA